MDTDQAQPKWSIDLDWYERNNRSISALVQSRLCPKCKDKLRNKDMSLDDLLLRIQDCCAQTEGFFAGRLSILESVFRLFLANGNQPLNLEELGKQLSELRGGDTYGASPEILSRLLENDRYYGLRPVKD
jgi:hypothetical protein